MYYKYFVIWIKLYILVYIKKNIIMPKSRHRKNHKKKVQSWKQQSEQKVNSANKEMMKIQEDLMQKYKEKQESEGKEPKLLNPNPETL
tara:strand:- start:1176 stop:1439 length:264 start_codon:yes stop_codon:yes gene_type:complete